MLVREPTVGVSPLPILASAQRSPEVGAVERMSPLGCAAWEGVGDVNKVAAAVVVVHDTRADRREKR